MRISSAQRWSNHHLPNASQMSLGASETVGESLFGLRASDTAESSFCASTPFLLPSRSTLTMSPSSMRPSGSSPHTRSGQLQPVRVRPGRSLCAPPNCGSCRRCNRNSSRQSMRHHSSASRRRPDRQLVFANTSKTHIIRSKRPGNPAIRRIVAPAVFLRAARPA